MLLIFIFSNRHFLIPVKTHEQLFCIKRPLVLLVAQWIDKLQLNCKDLKSRFSPINRADIKQYIGPPSVNAIFSIYHSCITELMRVTIYDVYLREKKIQKYNIYIHIVYPEKTADILRRRHWTEMTSVEQCRNSILIMTYYCPDLGSVSDWSKQSSRLAQPVRTATHIWVVIRHQCGISALFLQTSFCGETSFGVVICRLFSQAKYCAASKISC